MIFYLLSPLLAFSVIILQRTLVDLLFSGKIGLELSLILVVFAGFHFEQMRGALFAMITGFIFDCLSGAVMGLYTFFYVVVFFLTRLLTDRIYSEQMFFIIVFTFLCVLFEGLYIVVLYKSVFDVNMSYNLYRVFLPQALVAGVLSPALFAGLNYLEVLFDAGDRRSTESL
jgi:rod shape-determining protein MreD